MISPSSSGSSLKWAVKFLLKHTTFYQNFEVYLIWMKNFLIYSVHFSKTSLKWKESLLVAHLKLTRCMLNKICFYFSNGSVVRKGYGVPDTSYEHSSGRFFLAFEQGHEKTCLMSYVNNKGADQPAHPRSVISAFAFRCLDSVMSLVSVTKISSFCSRAGQFESDLVGNPRRYVFSWRGSFIMDNV